MIGSMSCAKKKKTSNVKSYKEFITKFLHRDTE